MLVNSFIHSMLLYKLYSLHARPWCTTRPRTGHSCTYIVEWDSTGSLRGRTCVGSDYSSTVQFEIDHMGKLVEHPVILVNLNYSCTKDVCMLFMSMPTVFTSVVFDVIYPVCWNPVWNVCDGWMSGSHITSYWLIPTVSQTDTVFDMDVTLKMVYQLKILQSDGAKACLNHAIADLQVASALNSAISWRAYFLASALPGRAGQGIIRIF